MAAGFLVVKAAGLFVTGQRDGGIGGAAAGQHAQRDALGAAL